MKTRKPAQKVSLAVAYICYVTAVIMLFFAGYRAYAVGTDNPIFASFAASVFFFVSCGIVLHVMGTVSLPNLKIDSKKLE
ncbi:hemerythrin family protein [bacterium endosymbiont of Escarpia laminata]|nr:MAG: hemerythrin family protein [bacterium endosymbiont of Escarpia laminata]RLJ18194.1 MAG: hemerythrin family protein [bacterium endosymbiont of Escarpia laminata]